MKAKPDAADKLALKNLQKENSTKRNIVSFQ
jgi:hypothetical protein